ncbi:unnamed protein product [Candidula unifasciata]|uniref:G-protein coupled receptors family 1 profile domain-containing protein n=1 Tax=Candidula unifasciata TaxID=100452 RepID=A0A8S3ZUP7_9EUPU|nr:unnamed protein product [Candidula unifasciata]
MLQGSDHKFGFISDYLVEIFHTVNLAFLAGIISVLGIVANILNIVVFLKQGFNDTVNISLFALAVSDLCALITLQWVNLLRNPLFIYRVPFLPDEVQHLTAAWPHACFARITSWITVYITLERCLCVVVPLKVKRIVNPTVAVCVLVSIFLVMFLTLLPDYLTCYLDWKFDSTYNRTMLGLLFLKGRDQMAALSFNLAACTQISSFGAVIVFTSVLVIKVKEKSKWRSSIAHSGANSSAVISKRDNKVVKMIVLIAVIYCICFLPMLVNYILTTIEPNFIVVGLYRNAFLLSWSFAFLVDSINSSINIIVYYKMSSKFRNTFNTLFFTTTPIKN